MFSELSRLLPLINLFFLKAKMNRVQEKSSLVFTYLFTLYFKQATGNLYKDTLDIIFPWTVNKNDFSLCKRLQGQLVTMQQTGKEWECVCF